MILYRNSEGYASPTEGTAYAHIFHEERMASRKRKAQKQAGIVSNNINAALKSKVRMIDKPDTVWVLAWARNDMNKQPGRYADK